MILSAHVTIALFFVRFNNFTLTMGLCVVIQFLNSILGNWMGGVDYYLPG